MDVNYARQILIVLTFILEIVPAESNDVESNKLPRIVSLTVRSDILYRFAETVITSTVVNELYTSKETSFDVNLPMSAFTSNFTLEVDGIVYPGVVKEKQAAKMTYDKAKRKGQSAAHVYAKPRDTNRFRVSIHVAAQSEVTFVLTYNELLQRKRGHYEHVIYIDPGQVVDQLLVEVYICESRGLTALRIPPVRNEIMENSFDFPTTNELALVERPSANTAYIRYNPSPAEQTKDSVYGISGLFKVHYDVQRSLDAGDIYVVDGYFTHFFAPVGLTPLRKRILFVLDVSGSMAFSGKMEQVKAAMKQILNELDDDDLFNIVTFESYTDKYSDEMIVANQHNIKQAEEYVKQLEATGGTNINDALVDSLKLLNNMGDVGLTAPIVVFLTDGDPTVGQTNLQKILNNVEINNKDKIQIFALAFGEDTNYKFLRKISARNNGFARKIYTDADASLQLTGFYKEISNVLLSKVSVTYLDDAVNLTSVTQTQFLSFFDGSELVVSGRLNDLADDYNAITMTVTGTGMQGILELSATTEIIQHNQQMLSEFKTRLDFATITEKTWAYLTINKLLQEELKTENPLLRKEIRRDAVNLAIKYNFVTPVTSMVVVKPENKKEKPVSNDIQEDDASALESANNNANAALSSGLQGLTGKNTIVNPKAGADNDPHFIINVKGLDYAICFDVMGNEGDIYNLLFDKYSGLEITAKVVANKKPKNSSLNFSHPNEIKTFLGEITIKCWRFQLTVTPTNLTFMGETIPWNNGTMLGSAKSKIIIDQTASMVIVFMEDKASFLIMRHLKSKSLLKMGKVHFLGFYIVKYKGLSYHTHGLLGQFLHRSIIVKKTKNRKGKLMGRLRVSGNTIRPRKVMSTLGHRLNLAANKTVSCWMVQNNGGALLDGNITDYLLKTASPKNISDKTDKTKVKSDEKADKNNSEENRVTDTDVDVIDIDDGTSDENDIFNDFNTIDDGEDSNEHIGKDVEDEIHNNLGQNNSATDSAN